MERNIVVERATYKAVKERDVEVVERKGLGHPDTLIDAIVENISRNLCKEYVKEFGKILHHNVDKGQICGGATKVEFGGGYFTKPIFILLSGRATEEVEGKKIPVQHIAQRTTHDYLKSVLPELDVCSDVEVDSKISQGSADLVELFLRAPSIPLANDTSFGVGFAPLTDLERVVLEIETRLNGHYRLKNREVGSDIKVMGLRDGNKLKITVACAFISKYITDLEDYNEKKARVREFAEKVAREITGMDVEIAVNTADSGDSVYLTVSGTSAEMGDDGSVGRGNRVNGLITPMRSMTLEAACGKNPVNHVGKIYSVLATEAAERIAKDYAVDDVNIVLLSQIGRRIDQPKVAHISVISEDFDRVKDSIKKDIDAMLENITEVTNKIVEGKVRLY